MPTPRRSVLTQAGRGAVKLLLGTGYQLNQEKTKIYFPTNVEVVFSPLTPLTQVNFIPEILFTLVHHPKRKRWIDILTEFLWLFPQILRNLALPPKSNESKFCLSLRTEQPWDCRRGPSLKSEARNWSLIWSSFGPNCVSWKFTCWSLNPQYLECNYIWA